MKGNTSEHTKTGFRKIFGRFGLPGLHAVVSKNCVSFMSTQVEDFKNGKTGIITKNEYLCIVTARLKFFEDSANFHYFFS